MVEEFHAETRLYVYRDEAGRARSVRPDDAARATSAQIPQQAAAEFLAEHADLIGLRSEWLTGAELAAAVAPEEPATPDGIELRHAGDATLLGDVTVAFDQTWRGIPVWRSGVTVTMHADPARIVAVQNTTYPSIDLRPPARRKLGASLTGDEGLLARALGSAALAPRAARAKGRDDRRAEVLTDRLVVARYDAARRLTDERPSPGGPATAAAERHEAGGHGIPFPVNVPEPSDVPDGAFRLVREVVFTIPTPPRGRVTWLALIDVETTAVLYLRPFLADVDGLVFTRDPLTAGGTAGPAAATATLNPFRSSVTLPGLTAPTAGAEQALSGDHVAVQDFEVFTAAPPTRPVGSNFDYGSRTNDFAAVNAYYHNDRFFRFVADLGFPRATYFNGTTFPVPVDHRGRFLTTTGIEINASCSGNGTGGIANVDYELADLGDTANPIGLSVDWRVVLHELGGHGILYDAVNSANFGFAHSAGDSFAAVLSDPDSQAADRFLTFPWVTLIGRRHDRAVGAGWGWGGVNDTGGYNSEQILSTTHFRIYRSLGGDSASINLRRFAARTVAYLMLRAVGILTPTTNPGNVTGWVTALLTADAGDWASEMLAGGAYNKVIVWAFEKQGLGQAPGSPVPVVREGAPPAVDVYIDDGRHGEYQHQLVHWNNQNVWNRRFADGGTLHEDPWLNRTNFAYVRVRNRGTQTANDVVVRAFHTDPGAGLTWPDDFVAMTTAQLTAPPIPPGGEVTVGPFSWTPTTPDHECLLMIASATGDPSNVDKIGPGESIAEWRLVPHDNNIAQRNIHPVPAAGGIAGIVDALDGRAFTVRNPFDRRVRVTLDVALPQVLADRGWRVRIATAGGAAFGLPAGGARRVRLAVAPGGEVSPAEIVASADRDVVVTVAADGIPLGGMTYALDPSRSEPMPQDAPSGCDCAGPCTGRCAGAAKGLLRCLDLPEGDVRGVRLRTIGVDIDIGGCS